MADNDQSHVFFKFSYKPRICRSRGAIVTMIWNFSALVVFYHYRSSHPAQQFNFDRFDVVIGVIFLLYPVFGWLADAYFGRHRLIRVCMYVMWICGILYVALEILKYNYQLTGHIINVLGIISVTTSMVSLGASQVNAIALGVDQFIDSSSQDISSYISWYCWLYFFSNVIVSLTQPCTCREYIPVSSLLIPVVLTLSVCVDILFGRWLVKEPVTINPLKLIFRVLRYAIKNKYPRQRSAFTYWDDKPFTRIDLGKCKYGGPFTTEQVEDVKTFFRILVILFVGSFFAGLIFVVNRTASARMIFHFRDDKRIHISNDHCINITSNLTTYLRDCFERTAVSVANSIIMVVFIPLFEIILYPLLWKCIPRLGIMRRFILGMILQLGYQLSLLLLEIVGHSLTWKHFHRDSRNITCLLYSEDPLMEDKSISISYKWITLTKLLGGASLYFLITSTVEFVCAQSPYSMKGILGGMAYGMVGVSIVFSTGMMYLFKHLATNQLSGIRFGCGVWYYTSVSMLTLFLIVIGCVLNKWYTKRTRDEELHNEQIFAVNYFDRYNST